MRHAEYLLLEGELQDGILPECDPQESRLGVSNVHREDEQRHQHSSSS